MGVRPSYWRLFLKSAQERRWETLLTLLSDVFGFSIATVLAELFGLSHHLRYAIIIALLLFTCYMIYRISADVWKREHDVRRNLEQRLTPRIIMVFSPKRFHACIMDDIWTDADGVRVVARVVRVGVHNLGGITIPDVRVMLESIEPQTTHFLPARLAWMHEQFRGQAIVDQGSALDPSDVPTLYVNIARKRSAGNASDFITIEYAGGLLPDKLPPGTYQFTLLAQGRDIQSARKRFVLSVDGDGILQFTE